MLDLRYNTDATSTRPPAREGNAESSSSTISGASSSVQGAAQSLDLAPGGWHDYLTLLPGKKFECPSSSSHLLDNLDPKTGRTTLFTPHRHKVEVHAPTREVYERIFAAMSKRLGMNPCHPRGLPYERYYDNGRRRAPAIAEIYWRLCSQSAIRRQPVQLTKDSSSRRRQASLRILTFSI